MARFFVSYSRSVKDDVGKVVELLRSSGHEAWWDGDIPIMADWWATILKRIEWCEVFIFVVSEKSVQSAYCLAELKYASDRQRPILPFIIGDASGLALPSDLPPRGQWLIYKGDPAHTLAQINQAYSAIEWQLHKDIDAPRPPEPEKGGKSLIHQFQEALRLANNQEFEAAKQRLRNIKQLDFDEWGADCDAWLARLTSYAPLIDLTADAATLDRARREWQAYVRQNGDDFDPAEIGQRLKGGSRLRLSPAGMSRPAVIGGLVTGLLIIAVVIFGVVLPQINNPAQPSPTTQVAAAQATETTAPTEATPAVDVQGTVDAIFMATQAAVETRSAFETEQAAALARQTRDAQETLTAIPTPTPSPTPDTLQAAYAQAAAYDYQQGNTAWTPVVHTFDDGVPMVLVPPGCFMMGSDTSATDQQPVTQQCFDEPFWIDQTEVTQADFERIGGARSGLDGFDGNQRPVEKINWFEARDFCAYRGGRLPAEREWEYAARGPDGWEYAWGNTWDENAVVWKNNAGKQTAPVGSRPEGASWVGALDLSGNVYEWMNSLFLPYDSPEDREADTGNLTTVFRVLRGGSWVSNDPAFLRAPDRQSDRPDSRLDDIGFRCVRSS
ncbi:MAG: SUMF1/EgtB/PvdO family nonheme iron enzyme [Anaerolineae bacterium]|nr:SUMF1/EgtB/PvdO family nonheme iron enzyme [Anaerolineae bacterium]